MRFIPKGQALFEINQFKISSEINKLFKSLYQNKTNQYKQLIIDTFSTGTTVYDYFLWMY